MLYADFWASTCDLLRFYMVFELCKQKLPTNIVFKASLVGFFRHFHLKCNKIARKKALDTYQMYGDIYLVGIFSCFARF